MICSMSDYQNITTASLGITLKNQLSDSIMQVCNYAGGFYLSHVKLLILEVVAFKVTRNLVCSAFERFTTCLQNLSYSYHSIAYFASRIYKKISCNIQRMSHTCWQNFQNVAMLLSENIFIESLRKANRFLRFPLIELMPVDSGTLLSYCQCNRCHDLMINSYFKIQGFNEALINEPLETNKIKFIPSTHRNRQFLGSKR